MNNKETNMKTVLVTGAGGYIGSILVPKLLKLGYFVKAVDRFFFGLDKLQKHENLLCFKDDTRRLQDELFTNIDYVIDLVAISNDPSGKEFSEATFQINHVSRVRTAALAKKLGVKRYILPSSCSIYGFQKGIVDETSSTNPLTEYALANEKAEQNVLSLVSDTFCVTVLRQSTVFGYSPRMRFDLAINGMSLGAFKNKKLPLMRDGKQFRPMVHVQDTTDVMCLLLTEDIKKINGEIFNVGGDSNNYQIGPLGKTVAGIVSDILNIKIPIEWYGEPDLRSYNVSFDKIKTVLNWEPKWDASSGVKEIVSKLQDGSLTVDLSTITLDWYKELIKWHQIIKNIEMYGGILDI